ncbi:helix-turn-helix domain-containing protein [Macrococcus equi]|uniref:helix-turn-helix domain-containing protein n=1 Tax=Macrococcus equi TaxID=3395462 RepID=UPI0039BE41CB
MNEVAKDIGKFIKDKRATYKISTTALANEIKMSQSYLSSIENATKNTTPSIYVLYKICVGLSSFGHNKRELLLEVYLIYRNAEAVDKIDNEIFEMLIKEESSIKSMEAIPPDIDIDLYELLTNEHSYKLSYSYTHNEFKDTEYKIIIPNSLKANLNILVWNSIHQLIASKGRFILDSTTDKDKLLSKEDVMKKVSEDYEENAKDFELDASGIM